MTTDADELRVLRQRAYGPSADIHLDPAAAQRLSQLEADRRQPHSAVAKEPTEESAQPLSEGATAQGSAIAVDETVPSRERRRFRLRLRSSTVLLLLIAVVLLASAWLALALTQRVQTSPLGPDATQVARLAQDDTYDIPAAFAGYDPSASGEGRAYQEFYGLRTVTNGYAFYGDEAQDECITVYAAELVTEDTANYTGPAFWGCAAGEFPAAVTLRIVAELPQQLQDAYPDGTALQFVLDERDNEIVVFTDQ